MHGFLALLLHKPYVVFLKNPGLPSSPYLSSRNNDTQLNLCVVRYRRSPTPPGYTPADMTCESSEVEESPHLVQMGGPSSLFGREIFCSPLKIVDLSWLPPLLTRRRSFFQVSWCLRRCHSPQNYSPPPPALLISISARGWDSLRLLVSLQMICSPFPREDILTPLFFPQHLFFLCVLF